MINFPFLRKYNVATVVDGLALYEPGSVLFNGSFISNIAIGVTLETGDVKISKDGGTFSNLSILPIEIETGFFEINLSSSELLCKRAIIKFIDQTGVKAWTDTYFIVETYGDSNAQFPFTDFSAGVGSVAYCVTIKNTNGDLIEGCRVWATTDALGNNIIAGPVHTDTFGHATLYLDPGQYYIWTFKPGVITQQATLETVI